MPFQCHTCVVLHTMACLCLLLSWFIHHHAFLRYELELLTCANAWYEYRVWTHQQLCMDEVRWWTCTWPWPHFWAHYKHVYHVSHHVSHQSATISHLLASRVHNVSHQNRARRAHPLDSCQIYYTCCITLQCWCGDVPALNSIQTH